MAYRTKMRMTSRPGVNSSVASPDLRLILDSAFDAGLKAGPGARRAADCIALISEQEERVSAAAAEYEAAERRSLGGSAE